MARSVEAATAKEAGREYGNACGLRVKAGGAVLVSYEDSPARIGARLHWFTKTPRSGCTYGQPRSRYFRRTLKTAAP